MSILLSSAITVPRGLSTLTCFSPFFIVTHPATTEIYTLSLHDALPICSSCSPSTAGAARPRRRRCKRSCCWTRSEEHTSELQSLRQLVCRLLLEKKKEETGRGTGLVRGAVSGAETQLGGVRHSLPSVSH